MKIIPLEFFFLILLNETLCLTGLIVVCATLLLQYSETAVVPRASILATEVEWLKSIKADFVVKELLLLFHQRTN